jgi:hypothetical protein
MSSSTAVPSDSTTLHVIPHSSEEKSTISAASKEMGGDEVTAVKEEGSNVDLEYPDGGWQAWGVVVGVSWF